MRFFSACALLGLLLAPGVAAAACGGSTASVFTDDFKDDLGGWDMSDGTLAHGDGGIITVRKGKRHNMLLNQNFTAREGVVCATHIVPDSTEPVFQGVVFWAKSYRDYYMILGNTRKKVMVYHYVEGTYLTLYELDAPGLNTEPGSTNDLSVALKGNLVTVTVNGTDLRRFRAQPPEGLSRFGFYVEFSKPITEEEGAQMRIKEMVVNKS